MRNPPVRAKASTTIGFEEGSPDRPRNRKALRLPARDFDGLFMPLEFAPSLRRQILIGTTRVGIDQNDVAPVRVGIGESPRYVRICSDHHRWNARQRDT